MGDFLHGKGPTNILETVLWVTKIVYPTIEWIISEVIGCLIIKWPIRKAVTPVGFWFL